MKIITRITALCLAFAATVSLIGCKKDVKYTDSWRVVRYASGGEEQKQYVGFKVTKKSDREIKSVWLRVDGFDKNVTSADVTIEKYSSSNLTGEVSNGKPVTYTIKKPSGCKKSVGWVEIVSDWTYTTTLTSVYVRLVLKGGVTLGEIGFLDDQGKKLTVAVDSANVYIQGGNPETTNKQFSYTELTEQKDNAKNGLPLYLVDEQGDFKKGNE